MSDNYTPSTEQVRAVYIAARYGSPESAAEFDRWFADSRKGVASRIAFAIEAARHFASSAVATTHVATRINTLNDAALIARTVGREPNA